MSSGTRPGKHRRAVRLREEAQRLAVVYLLSVLLCGGLVVTAAHVLAPRAPVRDEIVPQQVVMVPHDAVTFALQPIGEVPQLTVQRHARLIERRFGRVVRVLEPLPVPERAWSRERHQLDASQLLDALYIHKPADVSHVIGVTSADLYATDWEYLYGFSQVEGRVAVYSTARLSSDGSSLSAMGLAMDRAEKIIAHELGHTFGLEHCEVRHCLMNTVERSQGLERMSRFFCSRCERHLTTWRSDDAREAAASAVSRMDAEAMEERSIRRGDGLYSRGAFDRAWVHYVGALLQRPTNAARLNRVGVASAELGMSEVAHQSYRLAILHEPGYALPYYNFALLYASHDPERSSALLQAGFERDPDRVEALGYLASVYAEVLGDEHRALHYFQRYVREGGQNPSVLYRYRKLVRPSVFEFDDSEVGVIRSEPPRSTRLREALTWQLMRLQWTLSSASSRQASRAP